MIGGAPRTIVRGPRRRRENRRGARPGPGRGRPLRAGPACLRRSGAGRRRVRRKAHAAGAAAEDPFTVAKRQWPARCTAVFFLPCSVFCPARLAQYAGCDLARPRGPGASPHCNRRRPARLCQTVATPESRRPRGQSRRDSARDILDGKVRFKGVHGHEYISAFFFWRAAHRPPADIFHGLATAGFPCVVEYDMPASAAMSRAGMPARRLMHPSRTARSLDPSGALPCSLCIVADVSALTFAVGRPALARIAPAAALPRLAPVGRPVLAAPRAPALPRACHPRVGLSHTAHDQAAPAAGYQNPRMRLLPPGMAAYMDHALPGFTGANARAASSPPPRAAAAPASPCHPLRSYSPPCGAAVAPTGPKSEPTGVILPDLTRPGRQASELVHHDHIPRSQICHL